MELKLARATLSSKPKSVTIEDIEKKLNKQRFFYLDRENEHKNILAFTEYFEEKGFSVHLKEVKYGLADLDYIYEAHIL